jgi:rRNA-processing protein EBP2
MSSKPSQAKPAKYLLKPSNGTKKGIKPSKAAPPQPTRVAEPLEQSSDENSDEDVSEHDSESENDSDESDDVDEAGMNRLMELLGEGGLDDIAKEQLGLLQADSDDEEDHHVGEDSEDDEQEVDDLEDNFEDVDLEDAEEVDEDVVPHQKILINNKVSLSPFKQNHFY